MAYQRWYKTSCVPCTMKPAPFLFRYRNLLISTHTHMAGRERSAVANPIAHVRLTTPIEPQVQQDQGPEHEVPSPWPTFQTKQSAYAEKPFRDIIPWVRTKNIPHKTQYFKKMREKGYGDELPHNGGLHCSVPWYFPSWYHHTPNKYCGIAGNCTAICPVTIARRGKEDPLRDHFQETAKQILRSTGLLAP